MKRLLFTIFPMLCLLAATPAKAADRNFLIERLSHADNVKINGMKAKIGMSFTDNATIEWGKDDEAAMVVKEVSSSRLYRLSKRQFSSKGQIKTLREFFLRTKKTSTRGNTDDAIVTLRYGTNQFSSDERRIALVIGNAAYTSLPSLLNPQSDAAAISDKLLSLGFNVVETYDCNTKELHSVLKQFEQLIPGYNVVFIYYAGHGIQKDGLNYLIPVNVSLQKPSDIDSCISCDKLLNALNDPNCHTRIVIFDACRNFNSDIFEHNSKGLAQIQNLTPGTMLIYSTDYGKVASDGDSDNEHSPFAQTLLNNIGRPSLKFSQEIIDVASETKRITSDAQNPAINISAGYKDLILNPSSSNPGLSASTDAANEELTKGLNALSTFDYVEAREHLLNAANMGSEEGCYQLGLLLFIHDNNRDEARKWFTKAADMGNVDAMYQLGETYSGIKNKIAIEWYKKAAALKHEKAAQALRDMKK